MDRPYREMAVGMQAKRLKTIRFIADAEASDRSDPTKRKILRDLAFGIPQLDVFEACAKGEITADEGATILMLRTEAERKAQPWFVRVVRWLGWIFFGGPE